MCAVLTAFSAAPQVIVSYFKPNVTLAMVDDFRCEPAWQGMCTARIAWMCTHVSACNECTRRGVTPVCTCNFPRAMSAPMCSNAPPPPTS